MTESSDISDTPAKPQDYAGLRAELATFVNDFSPSSPSVASARRPQVPVGIAQLRAAGGPDELVVADIIVLLIEALKGVGAADNKLIQAHTKADRHDPSRPDTT